MLDLTGLQRRTARYEFADGLRDLQMAFWVFVTGCYALIVWDLPDVWLPFVEWSRSHGTLFVLLTTLFLPIAVPVIISEFGFRATNETLRRRWLWRNTGFIKSRRWIIPRYVLFNSYVIAFSLFFAGILLAIQTRDGSLILSGLYVGVGMSFAYLYHSIGSRLNIQRYRIIAVSGALGTLLLAVLPMRIGQFAFALSLFWVVLLVCSAVYAMRQCAIEQKAADDAR